MKTKVLFRLSAHYAGGVNSGVVLGEFNNWNIEKGLPLHRQEDGSLTAEIELTGGKRYEYRYLLGDGRWVNDDSARAYSEHSGHHVENCVIVVPLPPKNEKVVSKKKSNVVKKSTTVKKNTDIKKASTTKKNTKSKKDDLTKIAGIDKKVARLLNEASIFTYAELGKCTSKMLQLILTESGQVTKLKKTATWTKQAKLAAAEKWEELAALQDGLKV